MNSHFKSTSVISHFSIIDFSLHEQFLFCIFRRFDFCLGRVSKVWTFRYRGRFWGWLQIRERKGIFSLNFSSNEEFHLQSFFIQFPSWRFRQIQLILQFQRQRRFHCWIGFLSHLHFQEGHLPFPSQASAHLAFVLSSVPKILYELLWLKLASKSFCWYKWRRLLLI